MKTLLATRYVEIPEGVGLDTKSRVVTVKGPRGELIQSFKHLNLDMQKAGSNKLRVDLWFGNRKQVSGRGRLVHATPACSAAGDACAHTASLVCWSMHSLVFGDFASVLCRETSCFSPYFRVYGSVCGERLPVPQGFGPTIGGRPLSLSRGRIPGFAVEHLYIYVCGLGKSRTEVCGVTYFPCTCCNSYLVHYIPGTTKKGMVLVVLVRGSLGLESTPKRLT